MRQAADHLINSPAQVYALQLATVDFCSLGCASHRWKWWHAGFRGCLLLLTSPTDQLLSLFTGLWPCCFISVTGWFADKTFCWQCVALVTDFFSHSFVSFSYYQLLYCNTVVNCNTVVTEDYKRLMLLSCFNTWFITRFVLHLHDALLFVQCYAWTEYKFTCVCVSVCHTFSQLAYRSDPSTDFYSW